MAKRETLSRIADADHKKISAENLSLSFDFIDWDSKEFFIHGLNSEYYEKLFACFAEIKRSKASEIVQQTHQSLIPKFINFGGEKSTLIKSSFPPAIVDRLATAFRSESPDEEEARSKACDALLKNSFEVRVTKTFGRVHGFILSNRFHVVWFDPAHNLFPGKDPKTGKEREVQYYEDLRSCRPFCPDDLVELREENLRLRKENEEILKMLDDATKN